MAKIKNDLIGIAGVHFVAYRLSLRGLIALPTIRNTGGIDLLVFDPTTDKESAIQVKTSQKKVSFWPTSTYSLAFKSPSGVYVFLRFIAASDTFEAFLERADVVATTIRANEATYKAKGRVEFPFWDLPSTPAQRQALIDAWNTWRPT
jgi:hypothetical protein